MEDNYQSVMVNRVYYMTTPDGFVPNEPELLKHMSDKVRVQWAIDNSFDGLHIITERHLKNQTVEYRLLVLLSPDNATFWKLKYSGR